MTVSNVGGTKVIAIFGVALRGNENSTQTERSDDPFFPVREWYVLPKRLRERTLKRCIRWRDTEKEHNAILVPKYTCFYIGVFPAQSLGTNRMWCMTLVEGAIKTQWWHSAFLSSQLRLSALVSVPNPSPTTRGPIAMRFSGLSDLLELDLHVRSLNRRPEAGITDILF